MSSKGNDKNKVAITFDDGYENNFELAAPVLKKNNFTYTIFVVADNIGKLNTWDKTAERLMSIEQLKILQQSNAETGLHSFAHKNFNDMSIEEFQKDTADSIRLLNDAGLNFCPAIAYPYGAFPEDSRKNEFKKILTENGIIFGLKIKSKINKIPPADNYELTRINVKGTDSFLDFKIKMKKGKVKLF